jgi:SAM-dependent methyltransferase
VPAEERKRDAYGRERAFYHRFAWAYDLILERPGGPQVEAVAQLFVKHGLAQGSHLIDAGCGSGAYATGLASRGFAVTAVDRSPELLAQAQERARASGAQIKGECGDFTRGWRPPHRVDGVLCRGVLNDLLEDDERELAFTSFCSWLRRGGALLVDVRDCALSWQRYSGGRRFQRTVKRGVDTLTFTSTTTAEQGSDLLRLVERWVGNVEGVPVDEENRFEIRTWTWDSLERVARAAGFRRITSLEPSVVGARGDRLVAVALR